MNFNKTKFPEVYLIDLEKYGDDRGFFARAFCVKEFEEYDLDNRIVQVNNSLSAEKGTLRGMHYQLPPNAETKIIRCIRGSLYDVIIDLRKDSPTFLKWYGAELTADNRKMLYVPGGFAHGFITLEDNTEAIYFVTEFYSPEMERGIRWNDPAFAIDWPIHPRVISEKDRNHRDFDPSYHLNN
jgi:dTDP-4-dehydrorhamnose 3,5-epimerase